MNAVRYQLMILVLFVRVFAFAQDSTFPTPQVPSRLVNDFANVLSDTEENWLEDKLVTFDKESSTQISVITIKSLNGYDVAEYAIEIGNRWGIGRAKKNNGVVLLAAINDRKVNIATGYGLEKSLPDVLCKQIIDNEIVPNFKGGYYYWGIDKATDAIIGATKGEYKLDGKYGSQSSGGLPRWLIILMLTIGIPGALIGIPLLIRLLIEKITGKKFKRRKRDYDWSYTPTTQHTSSSSSSSNSSSSSSGNSNSFGGYGGGKFGGGGASGSW